MGSKSKQKGKRGELEAAQALNALFPNMNCRRGRQHKGGPDSPDLAHDWPWLHLEVKRRERFSLYTSLDQASAECPDGATPAVLHRRNNRPWVLVVELDRLPELVQKAFLAMAGE